MKSIMTGRIIDEQKIRRWSDVIEQDIKICSTISFEVDIQTYRRRSNAECCG